LSDRFAIIAHTNEELVEGDMINSQRSLPEESQSSNQR